MALTIRIRSLIDYGFKVSDLQDIFVNINRGSNADSEVVCTLLEHFQGYHFTASLDIPNDGQAVIYYVACAIVRSIIKKLSSEKTQIRIHEVSSDADMKEKE